MLKTTLTDRAAAAAALERKIEIATEGEVRPQFIKRLSQLPNKINSLAIANFLIAAKTEGNISTSYKEDLIFQLCKASTHFNNEKNFIDYSRDDVLSYLDSHRKTDAADPLHKWIGSYNLHRIFIVKFFRWLYFPDIEAKQRPKPKCVENIPQLKRREKSNYSPSDLWTPDDDLLFLRFCPSKRDRCYHAMARDLSTRPRELLKAKIKDVTFKMAGDRQYAEVLINGKTGQRHIPLINSIPYLKDWLADHPLAGNLNSPLICAIGKSLGRVMNSVSLYNVYRDYKESLFPKLLDDPAVTPEDKNKIRELLKKPWSPYLAGRHTSLTQKSKMLKEYVLRQHAGWTMTSNMPQRYLHYFGNTNSEALLEAYGLKPQQEEIDRLKPKQCPHCNEPNKQEAKFCAKCRMILSYDAYTETVKEKEAERSEIDEMKAMISDLYRQLQTERHHSNDKVIGTLSWKDVAKEAELLSNKTQQQENEEDDRLEAQLEKEIREGVKSILSRVSISRGSRILQET